MKNREYFNSLFDIYSLLLTEIEKETFINYYVEDLTLNEIAFNRHISKSSVSKTLNSALDKLKEYESILKIKEHKKELMSLLELDDITKIKEKIKVIIDN